MHTKHDKMSALQKDMLKSKIPPLPFRGGPGAAAKRFGRRREYTPVVWSKYYDKAEDIETNPGNVFRVYRSGNAGPCLVLLHGGGYSGLTWSLFAVNIMQMVECQVAAVDLRSHGNTRTIEEEDLSAETMSSDIGSVINKMFGEDIPPIILVGHSMGGAIAVHAAYRNMFSSLIGLVVIDVVEGTAMDALQSMQSFLRSRPSSFKSVENAIEWCVRSGQVRNCESARVSMPGQVKNALTGELAAVEIAKNPPIENSPNNEEVRKRDPIRRHNSIPEESEEAGDSELLSPKKTKIDDDAFKMPELHIETKYSWRIDLSETEKYWPGWFQGLSNMFLDCPAAKMLLLAGIDRLDKDLTIGQMQGKFQMQVLPQCGHAVHEDVPDKVAEVIASYMVRNKFVAASDNFTMGFPGC